jgi:hypothetical protein
MKDKRIFEVKYPVGSKIWFLEMVRTPHYEPCELCEGNGSLYTVSKKGFRCSDCDGKGEISNQGGLKEIAMLDEVLRIEISIDENDVDVSYVLKFASEGFHSEANLSLTKEEAEGTNPKGIMGYGGL